MLRLVTEEDSLNGDVDSTPLWEDSNTGDWVSDNRSGHLLADALISAMRNDANPGLLGPTVRAMLQSKAWGGVEVGFFHRLAERLI